MPGRLPGTEGHRVSAPVLRHFDRNETAFLEANSSDLVVGGVLSQKDDDSVLHPVAFFSKNLYPPSATTRSTIKKLLAIIRCFEEWRPELEGTELPSTHESSELGILHDDEETLAMTDPMGRVPLAIQFPTHLPARQAEREG